MTCASCVRRVEKAIAGVPGVDNVTVNLATERASVSYDPGQTNLNEIAGAVRRVGYDVEDVPSEPELTLPPSDRRQKVVRMETLTPIHRKRCCRSRG